ncbi:hypothetical protein FQN52_000179 [Onygenales sp. PD_12]|nr:hypothetical protein FQN52_000179 [Onygenales sp. PD_12]
MNPIIASPASLLVPWHASETVTCHCQRCHTLLIIAANSWSSQPPYLSNSSSICVFDTNILSQSITESEPETDGHPRSMFCKECKESIGRGVQTDAMADGSRTFHFLWSAHKIYLKDIATGVQVPPRLNAAVREIPLVASGSSSNSLTRPYDGSRPVEPSHSPVLQTEERYSGAAPSTPEGIQLATTQLMHTISCLRSEIGRLSSIPSPQNHPPQPPPDGFELMATALREVRAKGIEVETLKRENEGLSLKNKQLEAALRCHASQTPNVPPPTRATISAGQRESLIQTEAEDRPTLLNPNGKRRLDHEMSSHTNDRNRRSPRPRPVQSTPTREITLNDRRLPPTYHISSISAPADVPNDDAENSDVDELAQSWKPKHLSISTKAVSTGEAVPPHPPSPSQLPQEKGQDNEPNFQRGPAKRTKKSKRKPFTKVQRGKPRTKSLPASSTKRVPLQDQDTNVIVASETLPTTDIQLTPSGNDVPPQEPPGENPKPKSNSRRSSARLSRRSSLAPPPDQETKKPDDASTAQPAQNLEKQSPLPQDNEDQENLPYSNLQVQIVSRTIPNSQDDSDNTQPDMEEPVPPADNPSAETAYKTTEPQDPREKRRSQIAARDLLAKLAMQREEALEASR